MYEHRKMDVHYTMSGFLLETSEFVISLSQELSLLLIYILYRLDS